MKLELNDKYYDVVISYKKIKNMYIRVKPDLVIYVTVPIGFSSSKVKEFINNNISFISKNIDSFLNKNDRIKNKFLYFGNYYDICYSNVKDIVFGNSIVFISRSFNVDKWYRKQALDVFKKRYDVCFNNFLEYSFKPDLRIRKMTSRWGVCNVTNKIITLNLELIKLDVKYLDYVIYHELSHLIYPNHSSNFWGLVEKYVPDYKKYRKEMKNII